MKDTVDLLKAIEAATKREDKEEDKELSVGEYMLLRNIAKTDIKNKLNLIMKIIDKFL